MRLELFHPAYPGDPGDPVFPDHILFQLRVYAGRSFVPLQSVVCKDL